MRIRRRWSLMLTPDRMPTCATRTVPHGRPARIHARLTWTRRDMSTNFSEVLSVLAHELRSPLSVLQGYIRLLQRKRDATDPESAMLTAMLGATTRLAALGRQSSELAVWMRRDEPDTPTDAAALMQAIAAHAPAGVTAVLPTGPIAQTQLRVA